MTRFTLLLTGIVIGSNTLFQLAAPCALAKESARGEQYPFVQLQAENQRERNICLGLAGAIVCLEEATEIDGEAPSEKLAERIWKKLHDAEHNLTYTQFSLLHDGTRVRTCSRAAIQELAFLLQAKYEHTVNKELWQTGVVPDANTPKGKSLLETREKYLARYQDRVTSKLELKTLIENDEDGLVALAGRGVREFRDRPPQNTIVKYNLTIDPRTQTYPAVPSYHAFLITYDKNDDQFYVYDSDDPDRRWLAIEHGSGDQFMLDWHIHDHMCNGPSRQVYFDLKPLPELLVYFRHVLEDRKETR